MNKQDRTDPFEEIRNRAAAEKAKRKSPRKVEVVKASEVIVRDKKWLWEGHLLCGALELMSGLPGLGKSQVQISLVACVTAGLDWPDGTPGMAPANVIMMTAEDNLDQEVVPRLTAAGAGLERVSIVKFVQKQDEKGRQFLLGEDLDALEKTVAEVGDVALITIDPITSYMGGKMDSHKATEVRSQLGPLKDFAERMDVAVSAITHPPKSTSNKAIDQFIGSQAFVAACRIGHVCIEEVGEDGQKTGRVLFANAKNNTFEKMSTLAYRIEQVILKGFIKTPRVVWERDAVNITADEAVLAAAGKDRKQRGEQDAVQNFLSDALQDGEPHPAMPIIETAAKLGFTENQLRTARRRLHVRSTQVAGGWLWQLIAF